MTYSLDIYTAFLRPHKDCTLPWGSREVHCQCDMGAATARDAGQGCNSTRCLRCAQPQHNWKHSKQQHDTKITNQSCRTMHPNCFSPDATQLEVPHPPPFSPRCKCVLFLLPLSVSLLLLQLLCCSPLAQLESAVEINFLCPGLLQSPGSFLKHPTCF